MDLNLVPLAEPTAAERAALDAVLGPPTSGWDGGARADGPRATPPPGATRPRARRHLLLPALWALQERIGWISPGGLNELCRRLTVPPADAYGVATFYALLAVEPRPPRVVHVCEDIACRCHGSRRADRAARGAVRRRGRALRRRLGDLVPQPVPRPVRPRAGRARRGRGRRAARAGAGADDARPTCSRCSAGGEPGPAPVVTRPPGGRPVAAAAAPRRRRRPVEPRRLPRARRLRGAAARVRARPRGRDPRGEGLEAPRPRRRGVPDRRQVGGRRAPARAAALPRLQRRRVRARHVQGPRAAWRATRSP